MRKILSCIFKINRPLLPKVNAIGIWKENKFKNFPVRKLLFALAAIVLIQFNALSQISSPSNTCNLAVSIAKVKTNCFGSCDGSLTANPTKGKSPYTYSWSNGQSLKSITGLCKGTYTVTVTDAAGCSKTVVASVLSPSAVRISVLQTNIKCKGDRTGSLVATASGGSGTGYVYHWSNNATTSTISNLSKGNYTLTVKDSKGCTSTVTKTITEPAKVLSVGLSRTGCVNCNPCDGFATAKPSGGVSPYTFSWSNGEKTKTITGLCPGSLSVTVTDKNGCTASCHTTIPGSCCNIELRSSTTENTKCSPCNGTAGITAIGSTGNYTYLWTTGDTTSNVEGLCAGQYIVTVGAQGCPSVNDTIIITDNIPPSPIPLITGDTILSQGGNVVLYTTPVPGASYCWQETTHATSWETVGAAGFSNDFTSYQCLAFNTSGVPYVAYQDGINSGNSVMTFDGSNWNYVGVAGFGGASATYQSLAFDGDTAYIGYADGSLGDKVSVLKFDGIDWIAVGALGFSAGVSQYVSLAINNGSPYVAYKDFTNGGISMVMKFDGINWITVDSSSIPASDAAYQKLAFSGSTPFLAYVDASNNSKATVIKFNGANWETVGASGFSAGEAAYLSLAFDGSTPYLAYQDVLNDFKTTVKKFNGSNWITVGASGFTPDVAYYQSLLIDGGIPYVAFLDGSSGDRASVMYFNGSGWVYAGGAGFSQGSAFYESIGFNGSDIYVAYTDGANVNRTSVMKYIPCHDNTDTLVVTTPGSYVVTVTYENGCIATSDPVNIIIPQTPPSLTVIDGCSLPCCSATLSIKNIDVSQIVSVHWEVDQLNDEFDTRACGDLNLIDITNTDTVLNNICSGNYTVTVNLLTGGPIVFSGTIISGTINPFLEHIYVTCHDLCEGDVFSLSAFSHDVSLVDLNGNAIPQSSMCPDQTYLYTAQDNFGCIFTANVSIPNQPELLADCSYNPITAGVYGANVIGIGGNPPYTYLWSTGDTSTAIITTSIPTVTVTDSYGCSAIGNCTNINRLSSNLENISNAQFFNISPNPSAESFVIKYSGNDNFNITIIDARGQLLYAASGISRQIETGKNLSPGIYMLRLESDSGYQYTRKIIKTN